MKTKTLSYLTLVIILLNSLSFTNDDDGILVYGIAGFVYSTVLYISMKNKPLFFIPGLALLGLSNLFVFYTSAIVMWLPTSIGMFLFYLFPSLSGALLTLFVLIKMWNYKINEKYIYLLLTFIGLASIVSSTILFLVNYYEIRATGLFFSINCIFWWIAFSLGLVVNERSKKTLLA